MIFKKYLQYLAIGFMVLAEIIGVIYTIKLIIDEPLIMLAVLGIITYLMTTYVIIATDINGKSALISRKEYNQAFDELMEKLKELKEEDKEEDK